MAANEKLHQEYLSFLSQYGLTPREVPKNAAELRIRTLERLLRAAQDAGDEAWVDLHRKRLDEELERIRQGDAPQEERHPVDVLLEEYNEEVEQAILHSKRYGRRYKNNVYVGDFPTGSVNAEARRVESGYLVLINSGLPFFIKQVVEALTMPDSLNKASDEKVIDTLAQIVLSYLRFGDPVYGPQPLAGGAEMGVVMFKADACCKFVLAHEYGHLLAGHLEGKGGKRQIMPTRAGRFEFIKHEWRQEFEADSIGYELTIGGRDRTEVNFGIIDQAKAGEADMSAEGWATFNKAAKLLAALAAPFLFFSIDILVTKTWLAVSRQDRSVLLSQTHPSSEMRLNEFRKRTGWIPLEYLGHVITAIKLLNMSDAVAARARAMI